MVWAWLVSELAAEKAERTTQSCGTMTQEYSE